MKRNWLIVVIFFFILGSIIGCSNTTKNFRKPSKKKTQLGETKNILKSKDGRGSVSSPVKISHKAEESVVSPQASSLRDSESNYKKSRRKLNIEKKDTFNRSARKGVKKPVSKKPLILGKDVSKKSNRIIKRTIRRKIDKGSIARRLPKKPLLENEKITDEDDNTSFQNYGVNPLTKASKDPRSTFAIDVDTASYSIARNYLKQLRLPPPSAIRVEEFINSFNYHYKAPIQKAFAIYLEGGPSQFGRNLDMLQVGLQSKIIPQNKRKKAYLTYVIDISGSMNRGGRLNMVKQSLETLTNQLRQGDKIGIVIYNRSARVLMEPKGAENKEEIIDTINRLRARGSTNVESGLRVGYDLASRYFDPNATNRVILCSDGVANRGRRRANQLLEIVQQYKDDGIYLTTVGVGMGNYNDVLLEKLGDKGSGNYAYIDSLKEAKKVFKKNLTGTLQVVAKDTKVQVVFNPKVVDSYRLLGYENRNIADNQFRNDRKEGGQVGAGHSVTALYELKLYPQRQGRVATVYVRYKNPDNDKVTEIKRSITTYQLKKNIKNTSDSFKLASSVAEFAEILRESHWAKDGSLGLITPLINQLSVNKKQSSQVWELKKLVASAKLARAQRLARVRRR